MTKPHPIHQKEDNFKFLSSLSNILTLGICYFALLFKIGDDSLSATNSLS